MSRVDISSAVLVVDDEPEYLGFVKEYLSMTFRLTTDFARNLSEALRLLEKRPYRLVLVDLEVPAAGANPPEGATSLATKYHGLAVAKAARSKGYEPHAVIVFTVHDDDLAAAELAKIGCPYVLKGRPEDLKRRIRAGLEQLDATRRRQLEVKARRR